MFLIGFGQATTHTSRYAAGDMYPVEARAGAISLVVWAGTIGSVAGPALLEGSANIATALRLPELAGGYLAAAVFYGCCHTPLSCCPPTRSGPSYRHRFAWRHDRRTRPGLAAGLARPNVRLALAALVVGQLVMVLIMTGTPIDIRGSRPRIESHWIGHGGHTFGMFAFSTAHRKAGEPFWPGSGDDEWSGCVVCGRAAGGPVTWQLPPRFWSLHFSCWASVGISDSFPVARWWARAWSPLSGLVSREWWME